MRWYLRQCDAIGVPAPPTADPDREPEIVRGRANGGTAHGKREKRHMSGLQNDWRGGSLRRWKHILRISANASSAPSSKTDLSQPEAARRFVVGLRSVERYLHQWRTTGRSTSSWTNAGRRRI